MAKLYMFTPILIATAVVGCTDPSIEDVRFDQLRAIDELTSVEASNPCVAVDIENGHQVRVCVLGKLESDQRLVDLLPFLADAESHPGADGLHGRMPQALMDAAGLVDPFSETDRVWLTDVISEADQKLISIHAAESQAMKVFYLEYGWSQ